MFFCVIDLPSSNNLKSIRSNKKLHLLDFTLTFVHFVIPLPLKDLWTNPVRITVCESWGSQRELSGHSGRNNRGRMSTPLNRNNMERVLDVSIIHQYSFFRP